MLSFNVLFSLAHHIHSFALSLSLHVYRTDAAVAVATGGGSGAAAAAADVACWMLMLLLMSYPHFYTVNTLHKSRPMPLSMLYCMSTNLLSSFFRIFSLSLAS